MSGQAGPEYPGISDGLVFSVDPKNPRSVPVIGGNTTPVYDMVNNFRGETSFTNNEIPSEWSGIYTPEGYILYDGTDDSIEWPANTTLETQNISIESWVNWNDNSQTYQGFFQLMSTDTSHGFFFAINSNKFIWWLYGSGWNFATSTTTPVEDTWYHVVGTVSTFGTSDNMKLYINGAMEFELTTNGAINYAFPPNITAIGRYASHEWEGKLAL